MDSIRAQMSGTPVKIREYAARGGSAVAAAAASLLASAGTYGQEARPLRSAEPATAEATAESRPAGELVRDGNRRYLAGDVAAALELYRRAQPAAPDSHELAFNLGLTHLKLGDLTASREEFRKALQTQDARLANDALYALGVCDHVEALARGLQEPSQGLELAQAAIRRYHDVLRADPTHAGARDAWNKAAALWQRLKTEEPPPQSAQGQDKQEPQDADSPDEQQQASSESSSPPESPPESPPSEPPQEQTGGESPSDQPRRQNAPQPKSDTPPQNRDQKNQPQNEEKEVEGTATETQKDGEDSLEQAARELRRIMDRQRLNEKRRPPSPVKPSPPTTGKDW